MQDIAATDLAYVAGLIDGEGTISIRRYTRKANKWSTGVEEGYSTYLSVAQKHREILDWLADLFGCGAVVKKEQFQNTFKNGPVVVHMWAVTRRNAERVAKAILPYLRIKRDRAELMLAFQEFNDANHWRTRNDYVERQADFCRQMQELNGRIPTDRVPLPLVETKPQIIACTLCGKGFTPKRRISASELETKSYYCSECKATRADRRHMQRRAYRKGRAEGKEWAFNIHPKPA